MRAGEGFLIHTFHALSFDGPSHFTTRFPQIRDQIAVNYPRRNLTRFATMLVLIDEAGVTFSRRDRKPIELSDGDYGIEGTNPQQILGQSLDALHCARTSDPVAWLFNTLVSVERPSAFNTFSNLLLGHTRKRRRDLQNGTNRHIKFIDLRPIATRN